MVEVSVNDFFGSIIYELPSRHEAEQFVAHGIALGYKADSIDIEGERVWNAGDENPYEVEGVLDDEAFVDLALTSEKL